MKKFIRILIILRVIARYRIDNLVPQKNLKRPIKCLLNVFNLFGQHADNRAIRLRMALQDLGPIFVKFGQLLSTRRDLLAADLADELALLQDQVPAFDSSKSVAIIEAALGQSVNEAFAAFTVEPMASASVAQVPLLLHCMTVETWWLKSFDRISRKSSLKISPLLFLIAGIVEKFSLDGKRLRLKEVVSDYEHTIFDELDLKREAANCAQLNTILKPMKSSVNYCLFPPLSGILALSILWSSNEYGIPVSDIDALNANNTNLKALAESGVKIFLLRSLSIIFMLTCTL